MEYKCIVEKNCEDAYHHLVEAKRMGGEGRIAIAYQRFENALEDARRSNPEAYAKYAQYQ